MKSTSYSGMHASAALTVAALAAHEQVAHVQHLKQCMILASKQNIGKAENT